MNENSTTPTTTLQGDGSGNHDNTHVTSRGICKCTLSAISPTSGTVDICGDLAGGSVCTFGCFSTVASLLTTGFVLNPTNTFYNTMGEPFRIINQNAFALRVNVDCGGTTTYIANLAASGGAVNLKTDGNCDVTTCP